MFFHKLNGAQNSFIKRTVRTKFCKQTKHLSPPLDYIQRFWLEVLSSSNQVCNPSLQWTQYSYKQ